MIETRFKDTEVGRIPVDWELDKIKDNFEFKANNTLSRDALSESGSIQDVHYGDVLIKYGSHLDVQKDDVPYITDDSFKALSFIADGDIIIADTAEDETVGKATEVLNVKSNRLVSGLHTMWLHPINQEKYALGYLGYAFNAGIYHNQLLPLMQGTKVTSVSKAAIKDTSILFPPKPEQTRIAKTLSNIDALISELGKLIEKKRAIKQGAMQQLLTGKKRLKGFTEPWVEKKLGEIGRTYSGLTGKTKSDFGEGNALYITFLNVLNNPILRPELFESVKVGEGERQNHAVKGDLFFNTSSETPEEVGICSILNHTVDNLYLNSFCFGYRLMDNDVAPEYLAYYFRSKEGRKLMTLLAQGVTRFNLSKSAFNNASISIPPTKDEQITIASVFRKMDEEISALEAKREKYTAIKQGMMQQLLTGKIRLID